MRSKIKAYRIFQYWPFKRKNLWRNKNEGSIETYQNISQNQSIKSKRAVELPLGSSKNHNIAPSVLYKASFIVQKTAWFRSIKFASPSLLCVYKLVDPSLKSEREKIFQLYCNHKWKFVHCLAWRVRRKKIFWLLEKQILRWRRETGDGFRMGTREVHLLRAVRRQQKAWVRDHAEKRSERIDWILAGRKARWIWDRTEFWLVMDNMAIYESMYIQMNRENSGSSMLSWKTFYISLANKLISWSSPLYS